MNRRVLIIDDEADQCMMVCAYLQKRGVTVDFAHSLEEGLEKLDTIHPDILLLDNNLPDGLGWEQAPVIKDRFPDIQITLITAGDPKAGPPEFKRLNKPMRLADLEAYVKAA